MRKFGFTVGLFAIGLAAIWLIRTQQPSYAEEIINPYNSTGTIYYVEAAGDDANLGTSPGTGNAWKTMAKVESTTFQDGDTILFRRGESFNHTANMLLKGDGTTTSRITLGAFGDPTLALPILEGRSVDATASVIAVEDTYWTIRDLHITHSVTPEVDNYPENGIRINGNYTQVRNLKIDKVGKGIAINSSHNEIFANEIFDNVMIINDNATADNDFGAIGIAVYASTGNKIYQNNLHDLHQPSFDYGETGTAFDIFGNVTDLEIYRNQVSEVDKFMEIGAATPVAVEDFDIHHNLVTEFNVLMHIHRDGGDSDLGVIPADIRFNHNTVYQPAGGYGGEAVFSYTSTGGGEDATAQLLVQNNIFHLSEVTEWSNAELRSGTDHTGNYTRSHNLYYLSNVGFAANITGDLQTGEKVGDPLFTSISSKNFTLSTNSPAINAGTNLGYTVDYAGTTMPKGTAADMGAHEANVIAATPGISVTQTGSTTSVNEKNGTDTFSAVLQSAPTANVVINMVIDGQASLNPASLTFTTSNWNTPQTVTVSGINNSIYTGNRTTKVTFAVTSTDTNYNNYALGQITVTVIEDETAPVSPAGLVINDLTYTQVGNISISNNKVYLKLNKQPTSNVTVNITSPQSVKITSTELTFTSQNWQTNQSFNFIDENGQYLNIKLELEIESTDSSFANLTLADVYKLNFATQVSSSSSISVSSSSLGSSLSSTSAPTGQSGNSNNLLAWITGNLLLLIGGGVAILTGLYFLIKVALAPQELKPPPAHS